MIDCRAAALFGETSVIVEKSKTMKKKMMVMWWIARRWSEVYTG
jgi:hypothetical protein